MVDDLKVDGTEKLGTKKNHTKIIVGILLAILIITIFNIVSPFFILPKEIHELNENIDGPFKLGIPIEEFDLEGSEWEHEDGIAEIYYFNQNGDCLRFRGFPDLSETYRLTRYWNSNKNTSVFGIHAGDNIVEADHTLKEFGYKREKISSDRFEYGKGRVVIVIDINSTLDIVNGINMNNNDIIDNISIRLNSTDWFRKGNYK